MGRALAALPGGPRGGPLSAPFLDLEALRQLGRDEQVAALRSEVERLSLAERFRVLHELGIYHAESQSGEASSLTETRALRRALPALLARLGARTLLDVPCGDFFWMRELDLGEVAYVGADIVPEIVAGNRKRFAAPGRRFEVLDLTRDPLPAADLLLCRDLLIHLSLADVGRVLTRLRVDGPAWLLLTHFRDCEENLEIVSGDFRPVNLCRPPFCLPPPRELIDEESELAAGRFRDRSLGLWRREDLAVQS